MPAGVHATGSWTREIVPAPYEKLVPTRASVRVSAFGACLLWPCALALGLTFASAIASAGSLIIVLFATGCTYIWARDSTAQPKLEARARTLAEGLADLPQRLAEGGDTRRMALADLAELTSLKSRMSGQAFDAEAWRQLTWKHGTPLVVSLGMDTPRVESLPECYEEIDLESERPGFSRWRVIHLAMAALWVVTMTFTRGTTVFAIIGAGVLALALLVELGIQPIALTSAIVSPGRLEVGSIRRRRAAEAGPAIAVLEKRPGGVPWAPPECVLTIIGGPQQVAFKFNHDEDARIGQFLTAWLTPRAAPAPAPETTDEPPAHDRPHAPLPAGAEGPA